MSIRLVPTFLALLFALAVFVVALPEGSRVQAVAGPTGPPLPRLGNDSLDPYAAWVVESYTASPPVVPPQVLGTATPGAVASSGAVADPLRRLADETTP